MIGWNKSFSVGKVTTGKLLAEDNAHVHSARVAMHTQWEDIFASAWFQCLTVQEMKVCFFRSHEKISSRS